MNAQVSTEQKKNADKQTCIQPAQHKPSDKVSEPVNI